MILSDGKEFHVRTLGLFELDNLMPDLLGPFTFSMQILDKEYEAEFDITRYETPPEKPTKPEVEILPDSLEGEQLTDWKLYQAAKLHDKKRINKVAEYYDRVKTYILENACLDSPDRIVTLEDWQKVYDIALVPQLTIELIAKTLTSTYAAKFNGQEVLDALKNTEKGRGSYDVIKLWENKLMIQLNKSELEYAMIPLNERARKVCAMFLDDIMAHLEIDFERRVSGTGKAGKSKET